MAQSRSGLWISVADKESAARASAEDLQKDPSTWCSFQIILHCVSWRTAELQVPASRILEAPLAGPTDVLRPPRRYRYHDHEPDPDPDPSSLQG
jgi:hypothetical protein